MITQEEAKDFIRRYREVVLETPAGEVHVCGSKEVYEELIGQGRSLSAPTNSSTCKRQQRTDRLKSL
jgi:hypothetical protein